MSRQEALQIRTMRRDELSFALDLAAKEGWNPGLHDAECFYAADPGGFLMGELGDEPVGCISAVSYAGRYGFVGLYIVRPEFRGRGHGRRLFQAALERLSEHNIGLDGVVAQQQSYGRRGFRLAYRNIRYRGHARGAPIHASVEPAGEGVFDAVRALDRQVFPEPRDAFLRAWLRQPRGRAFIARDGGELTGCTVIRKCRQGWKIGPLVADDATTARRLYDAAAASVPSGDEIFLDLPEANTSAMALAAELELTEVFETARMYTGPEPAIALPKLFGVTTFELG
jgi:GNAT superfamily N-acetyltransferase